MFEVLTYGAHVTHPSLRKCQDDRLNWLVARCMAHNPFDRPSLQDLERIATRIIAADYSHGAVLRQLDGEYVTRFKRPAEFAEFDSGGREEDADADDERSRSGGANCSSPFKRLNSTRSSLRRFFVLPEPWVELLKI